MTDITKNKELQKDLGNEVRQMMLDRMENIDGVDKASWWPLAPGWWIIISITFIVIIKSVFSYIRWLIYKRTWQYEVSQRLDKMVKNLNEERVQETIIELSELIRRLAMHKYNRQCASLHGTEWLRWLTVNDSNKFNWEKYGKVLVREAYSPPGIGKFSLVEVKKLIEATKSWIV